MNERITKIDMSMQEVVYAMSGGNPGAVRVCMEMLTWAKKIDP
jgi:hypothetical protein